MFNYNNLDQYTEQELIKWLTKQADLYENEGESEVSDQIYDSVHRYTELTYPANIFFTGVGSDVRGGKIALPFMMSGIVQIYENEIDNHIKQSLTQQQDYIISDKLDGTSAQVIYDANGTLQIAYSRGNGTQGADITRHIRQIPNIPQQLKIAPGCTFPVRMEIIIPKDQWSSVQQNFKRQNGEQYKNARNATSGFMNSSKNNPDVYKHLSGVAFTVMLDTKDQSKTEKLIKLSECGFNVVRYNSYKGSQLTDAFVTKLFKKQKASSNYELDGVVINLDVDSVDSNGQPRMLKYKVADESNYADAVVKNIIVTPSKDGYLKPVIEIQPVELVGVTVRKCTGFNAKFIFTNKIQPGCTIRITRSGDVIPYCLGVVNEGPITTGFSGWFGDRLTEEHGEWSWSDNDVDAILLDTTDNKTVTINLLTDIFSKLQIAHLRKGNLEKLYDNGHKTAIDIINLDYTELYMLLGQMGAKIDQSMEEKLNGIYWPELVGSMNLFGRGISRKKLTKLYNSFEGRVSCMRNVSLICDMEGFDIKTAERIAQKIDYVVDVLQQITSDHVNIKRYEISKGPIGEKMMGHSVVFTGIRNADLEKRIIEQGGVIGSGVSGKTTIICAKDPNSASGKLKKARNINNASLKAGGSLIIQLIDIKQLEKMML